MVILSSTDSSNDKFDSKTSEKDAKTREETLLSESKILLLLNDTDVQGKASQENENDEAALDAVWNNFDGNQFDEIYHEFNESDGHCQLEKSNASDLHDKDIVFERSIEKRQPKDHKEVDLADESSTDYGELILALDQAEKCHADSQSEKTPSCFGQKLNNKNLTKISSRHMNADLDVSALTPMPSYFAMDTPKLRDSLKQFGVKPLPKKQAVKKLVEIYEFTHKYKLQRSQSCADLVSKPSKEAEFAAPKPKQTVFAASSNLNIDLLSGDELLLEQAAREMNLEKVPKPARKKTLKKTVSDIGYRMNQIQQQVCALENHLYLICLKYVRRIEKLSFLKEQKF